MRDYGPPRGGGLRASPPAPDMRGMAEGRARAGRGTVGRPCGGYFHGAGSWRRRMAEQAGGSTGGRRQGLRASGARGGRPLLAARGRSAGWSHAERAHDRSTRRAARQPQRCWAARWRQGGYLDNTPSAESHCQHSGAEYTAVPRSVIIQLYRQVHANASAKVERVNTLKLCCLPLCQSTLALASARQQTKEFFNPQNRARRPPQSHWR